MYHRIADISIDFVERGCGECSRQVHLVPDGERRGIDIDININI